MGMKFKIVGGKLSWNKDDKIPKIAKKKRKKEKKKKNELSKL